jgi:hypothetical protein
MIARAKMALQVRRDGKETVRFAQLRRSFRRWNALDGCFVGETERAERDAACDDEPNGCR